MSTSLKMKVKDLRLMYERCIRQLEDYNQNIEITPILCVEVGDDKECLQPVSYDINNIQLLLGEEVGMTLDDVWEPDVPAVLMIEINKRHKLSQLVRSEQIENHYETMLGDMGDDLYDFYLEMLPEMTTRKLEDFMLAYNLKAPEKCSTMSKKFKWLRFVAKQQEKIEAISQKQLDRLLKSFQQNKELLSIITEQEYKDAISTVPFCVSRKYFCSSLVAVSVFIFYDYAIIAKECLMMYPEKRTNRYAKIPIPAPEEAGLDAAKIKEAHEEIFKAVENFDPDVDDDEEEKICVSNPSYASPMMAYAFKEIVKGVEKALVDKALKGDDEK